MKVMVFDVGGTGIKYSVMDEQLNRTDTGSTPTPADSQEHFLNTLREIYLPHEDEVDGIALTCPASSMPSGAWSGAAEHPRWPTMWARLSAPGWPRPAAAVSGSRMTAKRPPLQSWSGVC